jgi:hypothetical protein
MQHKLLFRSAQTRALQSSRVATILICWITGKPEITREQADVAKKWQVGGACAECFSPKNNLEVVEDVKSEVLRYLEQLYVNHPPEFIYFKTLYPVFARFLAAQYFLTEGRDDAFREEIGITGLKGTLAAAQRTFNDWAKPPGERKPSVLLERLSSAFFKLLDELTIARSRKHILKY